MYNFDGSFAFGNVKLGPLNISDSLKVQTLIVFLDLELQTKVG